ncbi:hypothetical protein PHYPSEUDO_013931 [Phytophthora pseudosyringae]|uniref:Uncharacterized protein n=1 Tax=Phytophthora pseudosyringae TaxID=221518 RepID=A0A8T1V9K2_9STRA|nr:hypothetical protein PHYPSEUDO_013931 [Phytophthora pseudosyringae]
MCQRRTWTLAPLSNPADLPPAALSELRCADFQLPRTRVKVEYYPPLAHQFAGHRMFRELISDTGMLMSPMSFVLYMRERDCVRFDAPPAVLTVLYSGRLGSRRLTIMHFCPQSELELLQRGSTNANFSADFGAGAALPATVAQCSSYEDLLAAVSGLVSFGDALWHDHVRRLLSRVKRVVTASLERDNNTPERVTLTLLYMNLYLGRALAHLLVDSPHWWRNYCEVVRAVDYHSSDWQAALNGLALRMATVSAATVSAASSTGAHVAAPPRQASFQPRRGPAVRTPIIPEHVRRQIPRHRDGREPCLRLLGGGMCYGVWRTDAPTSDAPTAGMVIYLAISKIALIATSVPSDVTATMHVCCTGRLHYRSSFGAGVGFSYRRCAGAQFRIRWSSVISLTRGGPCWSVGPPSTSQHQRGAQSCGTNPAVSVATIYPWGPIA